MKITGLITEYNPFHNGHFYHIEEALRITGADAAVVVMSGDYVERGTPALMPKHLRTRAALLAGAGAVIELPVCYACGSAEYFAGGAVSLLAKLGCVDSICFGSECGELAPLLKAAHVLAEEPEAFRLSLKEHLKQGMSFPLARQEALLSYMGADADAAMLSSPNNILGIEYLKALQKLGHPMKAYTIRRVGAGYHDDILCGAMSSASAIRRQFQSISEAAPDTAQPPKELLSFLADAVPEDTRAIFHEHYGRRYPIFEDDFSLLLRYRLLMESPERLVTYADMTPELANRIYRNLNHYESFSQFAGLLKTRELTRTRISRSLLHVLLGLKKERLEAYRAGGWNHYARLLGFRMDQKEMLTQIQKSGDIPLLTKLTKTQSLSPLGKEMLAFDIRASELYETVAADKYRQPFLSEYQKQIIKVL